MESSQNGAFRSWLASFPSRRWDERRSLNFYKLAYSLALSLMVVPLVLSPWPWLAFLPPAVGVITGLLVPGEQHVQHDQEAERRGDPSV